LLSILKVTIDLCESENIAYCLIGGGCLGIVRHNHNLIPWDDDLDISIWAGDMPRFIQAAHKLPFPYMVSFNANELNPIIKIMDTTTRIEISDPLLNLDKANQGVFVDVVPMTYWPSLRWVRVNDWYAIVISISQSSDSPTRWKRAVKRLLRYSGCLWVLVILARWFYEPLSERVNRRCQEQQTGYISGAIGKRWVVRCGWHVIFPTQKVRLGNVLVNTPNDLHEYVRSRYGDEYMQIPNPDILWKHFDRAVRIKPQP